MFLDELAKLMEIEYVTDNNLDKLATALAV